jgi:hypothetical protein
MLADDVVVGLPLSGRDPDDDAMPEDPLAVGDLMTRLLQMDGRCDPQRRGLAPRDAKLRPVHRRDVKRRQMPGTNRSGDLADADSGDRRSRRQLVHLIVDLTGQVDRDHEVEGADVGGVQLTPQHRRRSE